MKSASKPTGAQRPLRANTSHARSSRPAPRSGRDLALDDAADERWDAIDEDIDLEDFDYNSIEDADSASGDWLADHDLALEIAQRALH